ncbi:MAG: PIG-L deacetylase family protein [Candidatus Tectomicrobia bacterium]
MEQNTLLPVPEDWDTALAVVAHPDDLEYGGASAIARWTSQGKTVVYLIATRGEAGIDAMRPEEAGPLREAEERQSAKVVGVDTVEFLDYPDGVVEYGLPLRRDIARAIRQYKPDVVMSGNFHPTWSGGGWNMADHRAVGLATRDAILDAGNRWIFPELLQEGHEPWPKVRMVLVDSPPCPTHAIDVTAHIDTGIASLEKHRVYIENLGNDFDPRAFLTGSLGAIGEQFGCDYAVGFEVFTSS